MERTGRRHGGEEGGREGEKYAREATTLFEDGSARLTRGDGEGEGEIGEGMEGEREKDC